MLVLRWTLDKDGRLTATVVQAETRLNRKRLRDVAFWKMPVFVAAHRRTSSRTACGEHRGPQPAEEPGQHRHAGQRALIC